MTGIRIEDGKITAKVFGKLDPDMVEVSDYYEGQVGQAIADLDEMGRVIQPEPTLVDTELEMLYEEANKLLGYLEATRYHLDIAQELGEPVWPEILIERKKARVRLGDIEKLLKEGS